MENKTPAYDALTAYLDEHNMRKTPERYEVLKAVESIGTIFTIEQLASHMAATSTIKVSRPTLFHTMDVLCEAGITIRHAMQHAAHYELRPTETERAYLVCQHCNSIQRVPLPTAIIALPKKNKFAVRDTIIYAYGICAKCNAQNGRKKKQ